jgi:hypothetical protein
MLSTATLALLLNVGCQGPSEKVIVDGAGEPSHMIRTLSLAPLVGNADPEVVVLRSQGGLVQEEVVYLDSEADMPDAGEVVEVPEIIAAALEGAPTGVDVADNQSSRLDVILEGDGGAVQEEVIYLESDEDHLEEHRSDEQAASAPIIVASLSLSPAR